MTCLLGSIEDTRVPQGSGEAILRCLFQARKTIAQKWQAQTPPSVVNWIASMKLTISNERVYFTRQGNYGKFVRIWGPWLRTTGNLV